MHNEAMDQNLSEQLRKLVNHNTVETVRHGFTAIDHAKARASDELERMGVKGADEILDSAANALKKKAIELLTGRKPQQ